MPVMIEPCKRPIMFELTQTAELSHWKGDAQDAAGRRGWCAAVRAEGIPASLARPQCRAVPQPNRQLHCEASPASPSASVRCSLPAAGRSLLHSLAGQPQWQLRRPCGHCGAPAEVTLAVLPFANLSSDPEQEYFSDGLTEEILNQLAQIEDLRVTARTSSFSFKGKNEDLRVIGEKLGVANMLEGSVRKDGKQLRITAQLISGRDGAPPLVADLRPGTQRRVRTAGRDRQGRGPGAERQAGCRRHQRAKGGTTNVEAYDKYLRAAALFGKGFTRNPPPRRSS